MSERKSKLEDSFEIEGEVLQAYPSAQFKVLLSNGMEAHCYIGGKMRKNHIRVDVGDNVKVEISTYGVEADGKIKGRITYRLNNRKNNQNNARPRRRKNNS